MIPRETLGLCCVHIPPCERSLLVMWCSHVAINDSSTIFTLHFTLQLCYKSLGILQRITKSQKVHFSRHDAV